MAQSRSRKPGTRGGALLRRGKPAAAATASLRSAPSKGNGVVYERLRERILSLELQPGEPLDEARLVQELGGSRTPFREAVIRLAAEGLVDLFPNRSARVSAMELPQLQEHLEAFELLQRTATVLTARRRPAAAVARLRALIEDFEAAHRAGDSNAMTLANWAFHHAIGEACGNRYLARMYEQVLTDDLRVARLAMAYECYGSPDAYAEHMNNILREHRELVDVIEARDAVRAAELSDSHSNLARLRVSDYLARNLTRSISVPGQAVNRHV